MKSNLVTIGQQFLITMLAATVPGITNLGPAEVQSKFSDGNVYIRKDITGQGGIYNLLDTSTLEKIGYSSFNGKKLPSGVKMSIERIRLSFAVVNSDDTKSAAAQYYTNKAADCEAMLRAAHLIINKSSKQILNIPVIQLLGLSTQEGMTGEHDCYDLQAFRFLEGDQDLDIQLSFPTENVAWTANKKVFVSVELLGTRAQA